MGPCLTMKWTRWSVVDNRHWWGCQYSIVKYTSKDGESHAFPGWKPGRKFVHIFRFHIRSKGNIVIRLWILHEVCKRSSKHGTVLSTWSLIQIINFISFTLQGQKMIDSPINFSDYYFCLSRKCWGSVLNDFLIFFFNFWELL